MMHTLYPAIKPYVSTTLEVAPPHRLYVEQCGNPNGRPVIVLHGGPGMGCEAIHRRFFSPDKYRIILFDQRGSGRSTPHATTEQNDTRQLIDDLEKLRHSLNINKCILFAHGWGATLALLYAQEFTQHVSGLILSGSSLSEPMNRQWFFTQGANQLFPDCWEEFSGHLPPEERDDVITGYHRRLMGDDELARMNAAKHWAKWKVGCATLQPNCELMGKFCEPHIALSLATLESHYLINDFFLKEGSCLQAVHRLRHLPMFIVHGRYDIVSPLEQACRLHQLCPASELIVVRDAGHAIREPGIIDGIVSAGNCLLNLPPAIS